MTVFHCDGFETYGTAASSGADVQTRITATDKTTFVQVSGGHAGDVSLIDDFETIGLAVQFPELDAARAEWIQYEWPDGTGRFSDYKVATDASHPVMVTGFRFYNADITPDQIVTIWQCLTASGTAMSSLQVAANGTDLIFAPASGSSTTISSVLTADTWHYIEIEFLFAPSASGGYAKIYVDGVEVADITSQTVSTFTFNTGYGVRIGCSVSSNQTAGNQFAFDDVYQMEIDGVEHSAPLGPVRVVLLSPTADATPNDWSPSTGADNYALVDEQTWDETDYVEAATTGDDDHYSLDALSGADTVHGIQIDVVCIATDGTPTLHIGTHDGSNSDEESMGVIGTGSTVQKRMFFEIDPAGGTWSQADVNAIEATQRMTE